MGGCGQRRQPDGIFLIPERTKNSKEKGDGAWRMAGKLGGWSGAPYRQTDRNAIPSSTHLSISSLETGNVDRSYLGGEAEQLKLQAYSRKVHRSLVQQQTAD